jgi:hypothetical protein
MVAEALRVAAGFHDAAAVRLAAEIFQSASDRTALLVTYSCSLRGWQPNRTGAPQAARPPGRPPGPKSTADTCQAGNPAPPPDGHYVTVTFIGLRGALDMRLIYVILRNHLICLSLRSAQRTGALSGAV